jgi:hypothetical protein
MPADPVEVAVVGDCVAGSPLADVGGAVVVLGAAAPAAVAALESIAGGVAQTFAPELLSSNKLQLHAKHSPRSTDPNLRRCVMNAPKT